MHNNWITESPVKGVLKVWPILITIWQRMAAMHTGWKSKGGVAQIFLKSRGVEAFRTKLPWGSLFWVELKVRICLWGVLCYAPFPQIHRVHQCCKGFKNTKHIFRHLLFHSLIIQLNMIRKLGLFPRQRTRRRTWTRSWRHLDRLMFRALVRFKSAKQ